MICDKNPPRAHGRGQVTNDEGTADIAGSPGRLSPGDYYTENSGASKRQSSPLFASQPMHTTSDNADLASTPKDERGQQRVELRGLPEPQLSLAGVIAVVGCDGSGKSTLTADLVSHLASGQPTELLYLGQSSGNILRWIRELPMIGQAIGRFLKRRSERAHAEDGKPASPDIPTALVVYLLSRWRYRKFQRLLALNRRGVTVVTDRYPQSEVSGFYFDGPGLTTTGTTKRVVRWLASREARLYQHMANHVPTLVIRLNIDAETAYIRKPDHKLSMLCDKVDVIPTLTFNGARICDLEGRSPYREVLRQALAAVRSVIGEGARAEPVK